MTVKRPRIAGDLADKIDDARGLVPFEAFVRKAIEEYLQDRAEWEVALERIIMSTPRREILHELFMEGYGWHWPDIQPDLDAEHAKWQQDVDEIAVEQEHEEP